MADMLDRVAKGLILESALPVSPTLDEIRRVEAPAEPDVLAASEPPRNDDGSVRGDEPPP